MILQCSEFLFTSGKEKFLELVPSPPYCFALACLKLVALLPILTSPMSLLVETPRKLPKGLTSPARAERLGASGTFPGYLVSLTDGTLLGVCDPPISRGKMEIDHLF